MNIDEIKQRAAKADYIHQFINLNGVEVEWEDAQNAIEYLLSKLETAEKALEQLGDKSNWEIGDRMVPEWYGIAGTHPQEIAEEALKQLRD